MSSHHPLSLSFYRPSPNLLRMRWSRDQTFLRLGLLVVAAMLSLLVLLPLATFLFQSITNNNGEYVGFKNFRTLFNSPSLIGSIANSLTVGIITTTITISLAFCYAYALTRSCMPGKSAFRAIAAIPLLAPSLLPAISLVYIFGTHGILKGLLAGQTIYGPIGVVLGEVFYTFPHALIILTTALSLADATLYEAGQVLGASRFKIFRTITLPGMKYGFVGACFAVFTMTVTDFGVPKVIGGNFNVLATDVYKQVVGWQHFDVGSVIGIILLTPAVLAFIVNRWVQRHQFAVLSPKAVPLKPVINRTFDTAMFLFCAITGGLLLGILGMAAFASFVTLWPYNLALTFANYDFRSSTDVGWTAYWETFQLAVGCAVFGTILVFATAYFVERAPRSSFLRKLIEFTATLPLAVPGIVLGLAYVFFFNRANNPAHIIYGTIWILIANAVAHFFTVGYLTATTALRQIGAEFEAVSVSLKVPLYKTLIAITLPICLPAILDISIYFFLRAMTTVSGVVFLYSADTMVASVSIMYLDDNGITPVAAAMAMIIVYTSTCVRFLHLGITRKLIQKTQGWRC